MRASFVKLVEFLKRFENLHTLHFASGQSIDERRKSFGEEQEIWFVEERYGWFNITLL